LTIRNKNVNVVAARRILRPYTLDVKKVAWWPVYQIGQRLCDRFDDVPETERDRRNPHVFIAGDACHRGSRRRGDVILSDPEFVVAR
jgi:phenol 2-monooxygenase